MTQAKIANRIKNLLQSRQITPAVARKALREQTDFGNRMIAGLVQEWSKDENLSHINKKQS